MLWKNVTEYFVSCLNRLIGKLHLPNGASRANVVAMFGLLNELEPKLTDVSSVVYGIGPQLEQLKLIKLEKTEEVVEFTAMLPKPAPGTKSSNPIDIFLNTIKGRGKDQILSLAQAINKFYGSKHGKNVPSNQKFIEHSPIMSNFWVLFN